MSIEAYREVALLLLISIVAINDLLTRRIPNRLLLAGLTVAFVLCLGAPAPSAALGDAGLGLIAGFAMMLPFYLLRGMAAGDVKMMAVVGAFTGLEDVVHITVATWCIGGAMALLLVVLRGRLVLAVTNIRQMLLGIAMPGIDLTAVAPQRSAGSMPYGVAIALGTIMVLLRHY